MALGPAEHYARGYHPTATCGAFGAAAAAGLVLGLDGEALARAFGIAGSQGAGSMEFLADGSWTKRLHPGWAASAGLHAAALGAAGFTAPASVFEGRFGVLHAWSAAPDAGALVRGDGFELLRTGVKPHACCRYVQAPIDAVMALRAEHGIRPADIERIEVAIVAAGFPIVCEPPERKRRPRSVVDAQFSLPFGVSVALARGGASPEEFSPAVLDDPVVLDLMARVRPVHDAALDACYPRTWPAWVRVVARGGAVLERRVEHALGDPEHFPAPDALRAKFRILAARSLPSDGVERLADLVAGACTASDASAIAQAACGVADK
jgi:2-methylcitrate dehydratase PrpD